MADAVRERAEARLQAAVDGARIRDPRPFYRDWLRWLKDANEAGFRRATRYYEETLIPAAADEDGDVAAAWMAYGMVLADVSGPGRTVTVDGNGRAEPVEPPLAPERMALHLPDEARAPTFIVNFPVRPTPAQQATHRLLVERKLR